MTGFLHLPPEVRLMIYRLVMEEHRICLDDGLDTRNQILPNISQVNRLLFHETKPLLYPELECRVRPSRLALKFFRGIGQLNRDALRNIMLICKVQDVIRYGFMVLSRFSTSFPHPSRPGRLFNYLTKCSNANVDMRTEPEALALLDGSMLCPAFANMHGYARATISIDDSKEPELRSCDHDQQQASLAVASMHQRFHGGIKGMMSPCPSYCRVHEGRTVTKATRTVHIAVESEECPACSYGKFLTIYKESSRSIFKALKN